MGGWLAGTGGEVGKQAGAESGKLILFIEKYFFFFFLNFFKRLKVLFIEILFSSLHVTFDNLMQCFYDILFLVMVCSITREIRASK